MKCFLVSLTLVALDMCSDRRKKYSDKKIFFFCSYLWSSCESLSKYTDLGRLGEYYWWK